MKDKRKLSFPSTLLAPLLKLKDYPLLYNGKKFKVVNFGLFAALSAFLGITTMLYYLHLTGYGERAGRYGPLFIPLSGLLIWVFARIVNLLSQGRDLFVNFKKHISSTGFNVHGGIIGAIIWVIVFSLYSRIDLLTLFDSAALGAIIGQFIGRLGCYNYGCCYGKCTHKGPAVVYTNEQSKVLRVNPALKGVKIHPTQLYTAFIHLLFFIPVVTLLIPLKPNKGIIAAIFIFYHGATRLILEQFRADLYENFDSRLRKLKATRYLAIVSITAGIVTFLITILILKEPVELYSPHSFREFVTIYLHYPSLLAVTLFISLLLFAGYGIHGRELGRFPTIPFNRDERKTTWIQK